MAETVTRLHIVLPLSFYIFCHLCVDHLDVGACAAFIRQEQTLQYILLIYKITVTN
jgi:hypothetical protein